MGARPEWYPIGWAAGACSFIEGAATLCWAASETIKEAQAWRAQKKDICSRLRSLLEVVMFELKGDKSFSQPQEEAMCPESPVSRVCVCFCVHLCASVCVWCPFLRHGADAEPREQLVNS